MSYINDPNTRRLATNCFICRTPLRDAKSGFRTSRIEQLGNSGRPGKKAGNSASVETRRKHMGNQWQSMKTYEAALRIHEAP